MTTPEKQILSRIDLHCYSSFGIGKDSLIRLYYGALEKKLSALVVTDRFPSTGNASGKNPFYATHEFILDLIKIKQDGWKQQIPLIVGLDYTWPSWLLGGTTARTLIFGTKAIDQLMNLEKYRKVDGIDADGNIFKIIREEVTVRKFKRDNQEYRTLTFKDQKKTVQKFDVQRQRWLKDKALVTSDDILSPEETTTIKKTVLTGESFSEVWEQFSLALSKELTDDPETGGFKVGKSIKSALILCDYKPAEKAVDIKSTTRKGSLNTKLPDYFVELLNGIEVSYGGFAKKTKGINYSLEALYFADEKGLLPVINSSAIQAEVLGVAGGEICNQFTIPIRSENQLIDGIVEGKVSNEHWDYVEAFCRNAKEQEIDQEGLAKSVQAENELGIIFASGEADEF